MLSQAADHWTENWTQNHQNKKHRSYPSDLDVRSRYLWIRKVQHHSHKSPRLGLIFSEFQSVHTITPHNFLDVYFNTNPQSAPRSTKWSSPFRISRLILYEFIIYPLRAACSSHTIIFDELGEVHRPWSFLSCKFLNPPVNSLLFPF
jgi:hypothetical protein